MITNTLEEIRNQVHKLLQDCVDQKLLYGGTVDAIALAQQAFNLATLNDIPSPWPEFAAYRLAHLKMRARTVDLSTLREIDGLFERASGSEKIGPIPLIYRLAVIHRLVQLLSEKREIEHAMAKSEQVFAEAVRLFRHWTMAHKGANNQSIEQQSTAFNMLEFASYILGKSYQSLEGISRIKPMDPFRKGNWFVLGRGIARIDMTEAMARWEFEQRVERSSETILIEMANPGTAKIRHSKKGEWKEWNFEYAKYVLLLIAEPSISRDELERRVVGTDRESPSSTFRQHKHRIKEKFAQLTGNQKINVFNEDQLAEDLSILGLVHAKSLQ